MRITEGLYWMRCKKGTLLQESPNEGSGQLQSSKALHRDFTPLLMHVDGGAAVPLEEVVLRGNHGCVRSGLNMLREGGSLYYVSQKPCW